MLLLGGVAIVGSQRAAPATQSRASRLVVPRTASIGRPRGVTVDAAGNVYFTSTLNDVFKLTPNGEITIVAGNSSAGFSGDGGPAVSAQLNLARAAVSPASGIAVDAAGNVYIADTSNHRVRKVSRAGVITTIAGTGTQGFSGDGGPAVSAQLADPAGLALDASGNLYLADFNNVRIRKIGLDGVITTVAGSGKRGNDGDGGPAVAASMGEPVGIAIDADGNLYIADSRNSCVRKVSRSDVISTVAVNGPAARATASSPLRTPLGFVYGVAAAAGAAVIITDSGGVRKLSADGSIATLAKGGAAYSGDGGSSASAMLNGPVAAAVDRAGNIFIADSGNFRIRRIGSNGTIATAAGTGFSPDFGGDGGPAVNGRINLCADCQTHASDLAIDPEGNLYLADTGNHRVRKISRAGVITTVAGDGTMGQSGDGGAATKAQLREPTSIAVDRAGNLFIAERSAGRVRKVTANGMITTLPGVTSPSGLAVDHTGNLYVVDDNNRQVRKVATDGTVSSIAGTQGRGRTGDAVRAVDTRLASPTSVAVDASGNVYVADRERILKIAPDGAISTVAGGSQPGVSMSFARITLDRAGRLYIAEPHDYVVRRLDANGSNFTLLGRGFSAASAGAAWAGVDVQPMGGAVDSDGNVYIADAGGRWREPKAPLRAGWREPCPAADCILKVSPDGTVTKIAGGGSTDLPRAPVRP